jgi:hypothetical protein
MIIFFWQFLEKIKIIFDGEIFLWIFNILAIKLNYIAV